MLNIMAANPAFLWMIPLAGIPVLFHLFHRIRKKHMLFSSLLFFQMADPRMSARKRIREWLVLLLRTLALLFLMLALSRPVWLGGHGGGRLAQVLIIDNSGSMAGPSTGNATKLHHARDAAAALLADMATDDAAAIVTTVADASAAWPEGLSSDVHALRAAMDRVQPTEASGSPAQAFQQAADLLERCTAARLEIHVLSDLQESEWPKSAAAAAAPPMGTSITFHRIRTEPLGGPNVSLAGLSLPAKRLLTRRRYSVSATLRNVGDVDASVRLNTEADTGAGTTRPVRVPAGETTVVSVPVSTTDPGPHWLNIWIDNDAFLPDNRGYLGFIAERNELVLFIGRDATYGMLPMAISPSGDGRLSGLVPRRVSLEAAADAIRTRAPAMIVTTWSALASQERMDDAGLLARYLHGGGTLFVVPACDRSAAIPTVPTWLGISAGERQVSQEGVPILVFEKESELWRDLQSDRGGVMMGDVRAFGFMPLTVNDGGTALLGLENGLVLLARRRVGKGTVYASGIAFDTTWSNLPLKGSSLAVVQSMALLRPDPPQDVACMVAGNAMLPGQAAQTPVHLTSLAGGAMDWKGPAKTMPVFTAPGFYMASFSNGTTYAAVRCSPAEGEPMFLQDDAVPVMGPIAHSVSTFTDTVAMLKKVRTARRGVSLLLPLLLLATACVLAEGWVVNTVPRKVVRP